MENKKFNPIIEIDNIVSDIKRYFVENGNADTKAIIGISGGKDSSIAAALLVKALGSDKVIGVLMPNGEQKDLNDAREVCDLLGIDSITINIKYTTASFIEDIERNTTFIPNERVYTNMPARVRMTTLYNIAAMIGGRVINTGNRSERYVGYTTKYGDLAGDYALLADYYVREIYDIGDNLFWDNDGTPMLPANFIHKAPADGMSGKTDEESMGFTYEELDNYLIDGIVPNVESLRMIEERHNNNRHKDIIRMPYPRAKTRTYRHGGVYENLSF